MITSSAQELWLGIQIRATQTWMLVYKQDDQALVSEIYANLRLWLSEFEKKCLITNIPQPRCELWVMEVRQARENIFSLRHSQVGNFVRDIAKLTDDRTKNWLVHTAYDIVELLCLLPDQVLAHIAQICQTTEKCCPFAEIVGEIVNSLVNSGDDYYYRVDHQK